MKLRWTDGRTYAETFTANDEQSFIDNGTPALRVFRVATGRMVHRGEVHRNEFWGVIPQLHIEVDGRWFTPGHIQHTDSGTAFFNPFQVVFPRNMADTVEDLHASDAAQIVESSAKWWQGVYDCWRWSGALDAMIMGVGDKLEPPE